jgi:hypothetical protein
MTTTRRDAAAAGPIPGSPLPPPGCGEPRQGHLPAHRRRAVPTREYQCAASRSTPSRRVVPARKLPDRHHHSTPSTRPTKPITRSSATCLLSATMPSTRHTVALTSRSISGLCQVGPRGGALIGRPRVPPGWVCGTAAVPDGDSMSMASLRQGLARVAAWVVDAGWAVAVAVAVTIAIRVVREPGVRAPDLLAYALGGRSVPCYWPGDVGQWRC